MDIAFQLKSPFEVEQAVDLDLEFAVQCILNLSIILTPFPGGADGNL